MTHHRMYGLLVDTEIPYGPEVEPDRQADWRMRWAPPDTDLDAEPDGPLVVDRTVWPVYAHGDAMVVWSPGFGRFDIDPGERLVTIALKNDPEVLGPLYMRGVIMSMVLELHGLSVLHANSIESAGSAVAFIGQRGAGKTTVTTALCAAGLRLLADDVVPVERLADGWVARSGYTDLRLRPSAAGMLDLFDPPMESSVSIDGRTVVHLPPAHVDTAPLHSIVVPAPSADHVGADRVVPMPRRDALMALLGGFRVQNFLEARLAQRRLDDLSALLADVPIGRLEMPLRDTWSNDDTSALRHAVEQWQGSVP